MTYTAKQRLVATRRTQFVPTHMVAGLVIVLCTWVIAWWPITPLSEYYFFPIWFGYILSVDGLINLRTGQSPISRNGTRFAWLFVFSVPGWWVFEALNRVMSNWHYLTPDEYSSVGYFLRASIAFSTVIPAILVTTELISSFKRNPLKRLPTLPMYGIWLLGAHLIGWMMLVLLILWPAYFFPLCWIALFFILDPLTRFLGARSIAAFVSEGNWSPVFNLGVAGLICGFFWEMWNVRAMPKWVYTVPHVGFFKIFEMPILGYGGYIPFALEIFAFSLLARRLFRWIDFPVTRVSSIQQIDRVED